MKSKRLKICLLASIIILLFSVKVDAKVTSTDPSVQSGGNVTITLKSSETVYAYKITLADAGGLTFASATSTAGQANGSTVNGASTSGVTTLATYTFKAPTVTETKKYSIKFNVSVSTDGENFTSSTNTSSVTVNAPATTNTPTTNNTTTNTNTTKSNDATLKSITIGDKTYSGSSLKNTISYTANADVNSIKISATKNNSKATVSGTGTKSLVSGQTNTFKINVTAEDGTKKTYTVNIIRLAEEKNEPNIIEKESPTEEVKLALTSLVIKNVELNTEFNPELYSYVANVQNMTELEIVATANKTDAQISIEGASDLKEGDNKIKVIAILGEEKVEYIIDVYNTIQDEVIGTVVEDNNNTPQQNNSLIGSIQNFVSNNVKDVLLITLIIILSFIAIRYVSLSYRYSKKLKELMELTPQESTEEINSQDEDQNIKKELSKGRHF